MNFELELKKGNFFISECNQCKKIVWPPSDFCNQCLGNNFWRRCSGEGRIIEFSKKENTYFGVVEIENSLKILGQIVSGKPEIGQKVKVTECGISDNQYFFKMIVSEKK